MKTKFIFFLFTILIFNFPLQSQEIILEELSPNFFKKVLKKSNKTKEFKISNEFLDLELPTFVDNSEFSCFRPIFSQVALECGQSAGEAYVFTYEINRLRNLSSQVSDNQYPTHFTWNFLNDNNGWNSGVSFFDTWEIIKKCGIPKLTDFGENLSDGGSNKWITGYEKYHRAMTNRIDKTYHIPVSTQEGLTTLKHWLSHHGENSDIGGIACFYAKHNSATYLSDVDEYVITYFGYPANHAMTIIGYNDSIKYDYNGDGQYTNDIDINNDGEVNMKDWEIGALRIANSWGTWWADGGYSYFMYKMLADKEEDGGLWNNSVYIVKPKSTSALLTIKLEMKHNSREKIKVTAGISNNLNDTIPNNIMEFPIFNYNGGDQFMQGGTELEENKFIEIGLDITEILNYLEPNEEARFFLQVQENDENNESTGEILNFSIIDYTNDGVNEIVYQDEIIFNENGITTLYLDSSVDYQDIEIVNDYIPSLTLNQNYSYQLEAFGGKEPYTWSIDKNYTQSQSENIFQENTNGILLTNSNNSELIIQELDFDFQFYNENYDKVYISKNGYLMFELQDYQYPYAINENLVFANFQEIAAFMRNLTFEINDGIFYENYENYASFLWKAKLGGENVNFKINLYENGEIEFLFGDMPNAYYFKSGISDGNGEDYQFTNFENSGNLTNKNIKFTPDFYTPKNMNISEDGIFSGIPTEEEFADITFKVKDANNISSTKVLQLTTTGILIEYKISETNENAEFVLNNDIVKFDMKIKNLTNETAENVIVNLSCESDYINFLNDFVEVGNIQTNEEIIIEEAIMFLTDIENDNFQFTINSEINSSIGDYEIFLNLKVLAPDLEITETIIDDGDNQSIDPEETCDIKLNIKNIGHYFAENIDVFLTTEDSFLTINNATNNIDIINADSSKMITFNISASENIPVRHIAKLEINFYSNESNYTKSDSIFLIIGPFIEDFETNNFDNFSWNLNGDANWTIDEDSVFQGNYSAKSGDINDNERSYFYINLNVLTDGEISFYRKVSCEEHEEDNYDYMLFMIDENEMARWDGEQDWGKFTFPVSQGYHNFQWIYYKDHSVSSGEDAAWVDYIVMPTVENANPVFVISQDTINVEMRTNEIFNDTLSLSNLGGGLIKYSINLFETEEEINISKNITGSYLNCSAEYFNDEGENTTWAFDVFNNSTDSEWIKDIFISFPEEVTVNNMTNFVGGSGGNLNHDSITGNNVTINWHGETEDGWGVLKNGETAISAVNVEINETISNYIVLEYELRGDIYGEEPHILQDEIILTNSNLQEMPVWISLNETMGELYFQEKDDVILSFNTENLEVGEYFAKIILLNNFNQEFIIPIYLKILSPVFSEENENNLENLNIYPNPFSEKTNIEFYLNEKSPVEINLQNNLGKKVKNIFNENLSKGKHEIFFHKKDIKPGIYFLNIKTKNKNSVKKIVII